MMSNERLCGNHTGIPEGYCAIPIDPSQVDNVVRLCALVRQAPDPAQGHLVLLRDLPDAMVYLGCLTDAGGRLKEWLEVWVQNVDGLQSGLPALREAFSNHSIDQRWTATAKSFCAMNPQGFVETGWETSHPLPVYFDVARQQPVHPGGAEAPWQLCRDDAALKAAGLPAYSTSLFRYLYQPASREARFVSLLSDNPANEATRPPGQLLNDVQAHAAFNPQGGLMMARNFAPLSYEDYVDLLSGKGWKGIQHGKRLLTFNGVYRRLENWNEMQESGAYLFLGARGRAGRFIETFHLKLQMFAEALTAARAYVQQHQLPFLNLSSENFRVELHDVGAKLPVLWTATAVLVKPGQAYALPVETSDLRYFLRVRPGGASVFQPEVVHRAVRGSGNVRIRTILPPDQGRTSLEGTLVTQERIMVSPHDLLWLRLPLPSGRVDLYGHLYVEDGLAAGEARFRTVPQTLAPEVAAALRASEGVPFPSASFEVVPLLSTPFDLYALGVLAVRTFLVNPQNTLAVALDEVLSLARQVGKEHESEKPLGKRIAAILGGDSRFAKSLAPHRLVQDGDVDSKAASELLPPDLWHDTLAAIIRLFPGNGSDSYCKDFGDAPSLALEAVFDKPLAEFETLVLRSRSLIVIDWQANREVHAIIRDVMDREKAV